VPSFQQVRVRDALRSPLISCPLDTPMDEVAELMAANDVDAVVVTGLEGFEPWGVVTARDVLLVARDASRLSAGTCARGRLLTIAPDEPLEAAVQLMLGHHVSHLMVVDPERHMPIGVLTTVDVAGGVARSRAQRLSSPAR
jgi:CBS domain-containing protein